jgi:hypothetical protein
MRMRELGIGMSIGLSDEAAKTHPALVCADGECRDALPSESEDCDASSCSRSPAGKVPRLRLPVRSDFTAGDGSHHDAPCQSAEPSRIGSRHPQRRRESGCKRGVGSLHSHGLDPGVDDLLSQLDELDARSKALHRERPAPVVAAQSKAFCAKRVEELASASAPEEAEAESSSSAARIVARQHPLESMRLGFAPSCELRWNGARCLPKKASASHVSLPSLKASASAPGCLKAGSWSGVGTTC